ncbi:hypothetical protein DBV15_05567 [Temnothorax longispinosus]|uniref:Uncharacterized protein n=1 Tax=Temnothorax longispinosus TaxID=300112 RepID=A0A4S2KV20_9HYME|nr:hypothetical protein DBV15_05567 [Temnothorax longispinosus]
MWLPQILLFIVVIMATRVLHLDIIASCNTLSNGVSTAQKSISVSQIGAIACRLTAKWLNFVESAFRELPDLVESFGRILLNLRIHEPPTSITVLRYSCGSREKKTKKKQVGRVEYYSDSGIGLRREMKSERRSLAKLDNSADDSTVAEREWRVDKAGQRGNKMGTMLPGIIFCLLRQTNRVLGTTVFIHP